MLKKEYVLTETRDLLFPVVEQLGYMKRSQGDCVLKQKNIVTEVNLTTTYYSYGIQTFCRLQHFHLQISSIVSHMNKKFSELKYDKACRATFSFTSYESHQKRFDEYGFFYKGKKHLLLQINGVFLIR